MVFLCIIMIFTVSIVTNIHTWPDPSFDAISTHLDQNHFFMMEIVAWNILLSNGKNENSLLGVWFWSSVSHFRSQPFVTGSYRCPSLYIYIYIDRKTRLSATPGHCIMQEGLSMVSCRESLTKSKHVLYWKRFTPNFGPWGLCQGLPGRLDWFPQNLIRL